jgi:hypothetical protein
LFESHIKGTPMKKCTILAATAVLALASTPAFAQSQPSSAQSRIGAILGTLFGDRLGASTSIDAQWAAGQTPLTSQRAQFESRVDTEVRTGGLDQATGARLKTDYYALVQLESRYGADRRFTTQERAELSDRYGALTQVLAAGTYADGGAATASVNNGRAEFERRVDASVSARRLTRTQGTRLKADYLAVAQLEAGYQRDGMISAAERNDLDVRLDALDARVGDMPAASVALTSRARLDAILRALPSSGLGAAAQTGIRVEHGDLSRLEAAYARLNASADERAYLESRLIDLETRARIRR